MSWTRSSSPSPATFAGSTVRLRFAEVDNLFMFQAGADAVSITSRLR